MAGAADVRGRDAEHLQQLVRRSGPERIRDELNSQKNIKLSIFIREYVPLSYLLMQENKKLVSASPRPCASTVT